MVRKHRLAIACALSVSIAFVSPAAAHAATDVPGTPTGLATNPIPLTLSGAEQPCGTGTAYASFVNNGGVDEVDLSAVVNAGSDVAPNYSAAFYVTDETTGTVLAPIDSAGQVPSGTTVTVGVPVTDGHAYSWTVADTDGTSWSATAGPCDFISDLSSPTNPVVTSTDFPTNGGGLDSGEPGSFTLTSTDPAPGPGLKGYSYSFDEPLGVGGPVTAPNQNGSLVLSDESFGWGEHTLYVQAVDDAGNVSGQTQYSFYVAQNPELVPNLSLTGSGPTTVTANGSASTGLYQLADCTFAFGDGSSPVTVPASACTDQHDYAQDGTYPVTLTITDQYGNTKSVTENFTTPGLSKGELFHQVVDGQQAGWASPTGSTGISQAAITALPDGSSQLVAVTTNGTLEHNIRYANGTWQGWRTLTQPGVTVTDASIAGMPNGSSQIVEVTSAGVLEHNIRNANGTWQSGGWSSPTGSTGITQAAITALPDGSSEVLAVTSAGVVENNVRSASGSWWSSGWGQIYQTVHVIRPSNVSIAGMPDGAAQLIEVSAI